MSLGGEIMEEHYDKLIQDFLKKLEDRAKLPFGGDVAGFAQATTLSWVIEKYKEHFKNNGIYG